MKHKYWAKKAGRLKKALTVGLPRCNDLVDDGLIVLLDADGKPTSADDYQEGNQWTLSLDGAAVLAIYDMEWASAWWATLGRRN